MRVEISWRMRVKISALLATTALVASACGSESSQATTPAVETTTTTTTPIVEPGEAAPAQPSFDEVEGDYIESRDALLAEGRAVTDLVLTNDPDALYARFDDSMVAQLSIEELGGTLDDVLARAPLTGPVADRAFPQSPAVGLYRAELEWGEEMLRLTALFDEARGISALTLEPQPSLPPDPAAGYESEVEFRLPFDGLWFVFWGGDEALDNYHVVAPDQRHAYDIVVWKEGGTHEGLASVNENYWAYGRAVLAPAAGTVVTAIDGLPDQTPQQESDVANPAGNHVVIEVADGEFLLIAHLQPGSLTVAEGDVVESGQQLGLVGNSGNTSEPHIHIHLQDQPTFDPATAIGLPLVFTDYLADGQPVDRGQPVADQFIASG